MSSERTFFSHMEEFGIFSHIYERLPPDFTAVFEIARVLEDESSDLRRLLEPALTLAASGDSHQKDTLEEFHRDAHTGEEYEADLMQSHRDIARIYPSQFLLPEPVFYQRLAERTLWMPVAKAPKIVPVQSGEEGFTLDSRKQKVYVLFDTSSSMSQHHRIHLAKAILYYFLKRNKIEMGYVALRTFDDHVGEIHSAMDEESYHAMLRHVLRLTHLGDGTVLQKALLTALDDIQSIEHHSGAEILIITDGAVTLDEPLIREKLGDTIKLHTIKIGHVQNYASDNFIDEQLNAGKGLKDKLLLDLLRQEKELTYSSDHTQAKDRHKILEANLSKIRTEIASRRAVLRETFKEIYGHELERLSSVYINIDDFNETSLFRADPETIGDLEELAEALEREAEEFLTSDLSKRIAILHDHLGFLVKYESDPALRDRLQKLDIRLKRLLSLASGGDLGASGDPNQRATHSHAIPMTDEDMRDLQFILQIGGEGEGGSLKQLLRLLWKGLIKKVSKWSDGKERP